MRIAAISDTQGRTEWEIPACDIFIHAGDLTSDGSLAETAAFAKRLREAIRSEEGPKWAMIVPGNHDACFASQLPEVRALFGSNVHVLIGESITICGVRFFGSPWTPRCMRWYFMLSEEELAVHYRSIPDTLNVLITHGPAWGILDPGWKTDHAGSMALRNAIATREVQHHVSATCTAQAVSPGGWVERPSTTLRHTTKAIA